MKGGCEGGALSWLGRWCYWETLTLSLAHSLSLSHTQTHTDTLTHTHSCAKFARQIQVQGHHLEEEWPLDYGGARVWMPLNPSPYTLHPTPYNLHPTPQTLNPKPSIVN